MLNASFFIYILNGFICISEALEAFNVNEHKVSREKRSAFNEDEKKIAGVSR